MNIFIFIHILYTFLFKIYECKQGIMNHTHPLSDCLLGVYFKILLECFEQFFFEF
jgi:hypothetical protein